MQNNNEKDIITASEILSKYNGASVQDLIDETPEIISAELTILASKLWEAGSLIVKAEQDYTRKWIEMRANCKTDKECDIKMKGLDEYALLRKSQYAEKSIIELIRALKKLLQAKMIEFQNS